MDFQELFCHHRQLLRHRLSLLHKRLCLFDVYAPMVTLYTQQVSQSQLPIHKMMK